ncbi:hypothetical protein niasHT_014005 [Heterodera trifolii]|uniref:Uncharacterized protein n=1 Tax=Heterodera trifolii TaxID=157864 RepID=A0ABD2KY89_9BILA
MLSITAKCLYCSERRGTRTKGRRRATRRVLDTRNVRCLDAVPLAACRTQSTPVGVGLNHGPLFSCSIAGGKCLSTLTSHNRFGRLTINVFDWALWNGFNFCNRFANFLHLEEQPMAHNRLRPIKEVGVSSRASLAVLIMSKNGVKVLNRRDFEGMRNLNALELAENRIETHEEMFSFLPKLKHLDLSGNPVNTWSPHIFWFFIFLNFSVILNPQGLSPFTQHLDLSRTGLLAAQAAQTVFPALFEFVGQFSVRIAAGGH